MNVKKALTEEFKIIFKKLQERIKDKEDIDEIEKVWVDALVDCYEGESMKDNHIIEGIMKNSLRYIV